MKYELSIDDRALYNRDINIKAVLDDIAYKAIYQLVLPFDSEAGIFLNEFGHLETTVQDFEDPTQGDTILKDEEKLDLATFTASKCKIFRGCLKKNNLTGVIPAINFSKSDLYRMPQAILPGKINIIIAKMTANLGILAPYQVTAATVQLIQDKLDAFVASRQKVRLNQSHKQAQFKAVQHRFDTTNTSVDFLKDFAEIFLTINKEFYNVLQDSFKITDGTFGFVSVRGYVNDKVDGLPVQQVRVKITAPDFDEQETETSELGYFQFKNIPYGTYTLTFTRIGYKTVTMEINVLENIHTEVDLLFEKET